MNDNPMIIIRIEIPSPKGVTGGKTLFLIPRENSGLVTYKYVERNFSDFTFVERVPEIMNAKEYIEKNVGIRTDYVDTIDNVLNYEK